MKGSLLDMSWLLFQGSAGFFNGFYFLIGLT
jgi:hypothetical protein